MPELNRREFIALAAVAPPGLAQNREMVRLEPSGLLGSIRKEDTKAPIDGAAWYLAESEKDGISWRFAEGALAKAKYLFSDMLVDELNVLVFSLALREGENGRTFRFAFGALPQCSLRMRMPTSMVDQNRWMADREGAFLKPMAGGERVDLTKVDRMTLTVLRKAPGPVRWCMADVYAAPATVARLRSPILPNGPLLDEFGQSAQRRWLGRTRSAEQLKGRLNEQYEGAAKQTWPGVFSRWGGWNALKLGRSLRIFSHAFRREALVAGRPGWLCFLVFRAGLCPRRYGRALRRDRSGALHSSHAKGLPGGISARRRITGKGRQFSGCEHGAGVRCRGVERQMVTHCTGRDEAAAVQHRRQLVGVGIRQQGCFPVRSAA
jgi:hypothetical protein